MNELMMINTRMNGTRFAVENKGIGGFGATNSSIMEYHCRRYAAAEWTILFAISHCVMSTSQTAHRILWRHFYNWILQRTAMNRISSS